MFREVSSKSGGARRDWQLIAIVAVAIALMLGAAAPAASALLLTRSYVAYKEDLQESFLYAEQNGSMTVTVDGRAGQLSSGGATQIHNAIVFDVGMGRPVAKRNIPAEGESIVLSFGEGSTLSIRPVTVTDEHGEELNGVLLAYERADGSAYAYDSEAVAYELFRSLVERG